MTAAELQRDLVEEMKKLFQEITTENTSGETVTGLNVYEQNLPVVTDDEEDESQFFPYALVKLETGKTADDDSPWVVATEIHFGICDDSGCGGQICSRASSEPEVQSGAGHRMGRSG